MSNKNSWLSFKLSKNNKKLIKNINMNIDDIDKINDNLIHMTCVFMGRLLQGKQVRLLVKINEIIAIYIEKLKMMNITLEFDRYDYLPFNKPKKKLLIAVYKDNKELSLWNQNLRIELNKWGVCNYTDNNFMPHITIGKLINGGLPNIKNIKEYPNIILDELYLDGLINKYILN